MNMETHNTPAGLYRSRNGAIFGVCRGLSNYFDFSVTWIRVGAVVATPFLGFWPVLIAYIIAALVMKPEPAVPFASSDDEEFYQSYMSSREMAIHRIKRTYDSVERRIRRLEDIVTDRDYSWESRLNEEL